jgi:polar amino acid transport system ATP-binding protein
MSQVLVEDVHKSFGALNVLQRITLSVDKGQVVALIGRSGSGKGTALRCINGLEKIDRGNIRVAGHELDGDPAHLRELRADVGIIFHFSDKPLPTAAV